MTRGSKTQRRQCSPDKVGWWGRLFAALLFAFYVSFIPIHLATETHLNDSVASVVDADHHHDGDHHTPHRASDHALTLTASAKVPSVSALAVFFLPAVTSILLSEPEPQPPIPVFERIRPPGESPPDPLQPRAPPLS